MACVHQGTNPPIEVLPIPMTSRPSRLMSSHRLRALFCTLLGMFAACQQPASSPTPSLPLGMAVTGDMALVSLLLGQLQQLEGSRAAQAAESLMDRLSRCEAVEGHATDGSLETLIGALACRPSPSALPSLEALRGTHALAFVLPIGSEARLSGVASVDEGAQIHIEGVLHAPPHDGAWALVLPGSESVAPARLNPHQSLLHIRAKPASGIDLEALLPEGDDFQGIMRLQGKILSGAVLDGSWELAAYPPQPGQHALAPVLALGFTLRAAAVRALEAMIRDLQSTYPVHRSPYSVGAADGACLLDLNIMPAFAPCYLATENAIVIGWNPHALAMALAGEGEGPSTGGSPSSKQKDVSGGTLVTGLMAEISWHRFAQADGLLTRAMNPDAQPQEGHYPWREMRLAVRQGAERLHVRLVITPAEAL